MAAPLRIEDGFNVPAQNNEAEMCVLGCCLMSDRALFESRTVLTESSFYVPAHQEIFRSICGLADRKSAIDLVTLRDDLSARRKLAEVGGIDYLVQLVDVVPSAQNALHYSAIVRDKSSLRKAETAMLAALAALREPDGDASKLLLDALSIATSGLVPGGDGALIDVSQIKGEDTKGVSTGFHRLDSKYTSRGWPQGQWSCVKAETGTGKTPFLTQQALNCFRSGGLVVYAIFADLSPAQWRARLVRLVSGVGAPRDLEEAQKKAEASSEVDDAFVENRILVYDGSRGLAKTVEGFCSQMLALESRRHVSLICADHLQRIGSARQFKTPYERIVYVGERLLDMIPDMPGTAGLMASQVNKDGGARYGAEFENDAATLLTLKQDADHAEQYEFEIGKNRFGEMASLKGFELARPHLAFVDRRFDEKGSAV